MNWRTRYPAQPNGGKKGCRRRKGGKYQIIQPITVNNTILPDPIDIIDIIDGNNQIIDIGGKPRCRRDRICRLSDVEMLAGEYDEVMAEINESLLFNESDIDGDFDEFGDEEDDFDESQVVSISAEWDVDAEAFALQDALYEIDDGGDDEDGDLDGEDLDGDIVELVNNGTEFTEERGGKGKKGKKGRRGNKADCMAMDARGLCTLSAMDWCGFT